MTGLQPKIDQQNKYRALLDEVHVLRGQGTSHMRDMDSNVAAMKHWLMTHIGTTWAAATRPNQNSRLGIARRGSLPWVEIQREMTRVGRQSVANHVEEVVRRLSRSFYGFAP